MQISPVCSGEESVTALPSSSRNQTSYAAPGRPSASGLVAADATFTDRFTGRPAMARVTAIAPHEASRALDGDRAETHVVRSGDVDGDGDFDVVVGMESHSGDFFGSGVVLVYLKATITGDVDDLDSIMDWEALRLDESDDPWVAEASTEEFATHVKELLAKFGEGSDFPEEALGFLGIGISEAIDGDTATVSMRGASTVFELTRQGARWLIVKRPY